MKVKKANKLTLLLIVTVLMSGCNSDTKLIHSPSYLEVKENLEGLKSEIKTGKDEIGTSTSKLLPVIIQSGVVDDFYVDTEEFEKSKEVFLPESFNSKAVITIEDSIENVIKMVTETILHGTGITIVVEEIKKSEESESGDLQQEMPLSDEAGPSMLLDMPEGGGVEYDETGVVGSEEENDDSISFFYDGDLRGLVHKVGLLKRMKWRYDRSTDSIIYSAQETKTYTLPIYAHSTTASVSVSSSSSSTAGSNSGSTSSSIASASESKPWEYIISGLTDIITDNGSFSINKETGTIEVTDSFLNIRKVDAYIRNLQELYSTQILIDVRIIHLADMITNSKEINWNSINNKIGNVVASSTFGSDIGSGAKSLLLGYKKDPEASENNISAAINLLSSYAESYSVDSFSAITTNFRPVPIQLSSSIVYFDKEQEDGGVDESTVTKYTAKEKQIGTTITLTPAIIKDSINLSYVFQKTEVSSVEAAPSGTKHPLTATKTFVQNVKLKNSIPLVISAINTSTSRNNSSSPLATGAWFLGGSEENATTTTKDIVLVTISKLRDNLSDYKNTYFDDKVVTLSDYQYK